MNDQLARSLCGLAFFIFSFCYHLPLQPLQDFSKHSLVSSALQLLSPRILTHSQQVSPSFMEETETRGPEAPLSSHKPSSPRPAKSCLLLLPGVPSLFSASLCHFSPIISHLFFFFSLSVTVEDRNPSVYRLQTKSTHFHTIYPDVNPNRYTGTIQHRAKEGNLTTHALPH